jgi:predicted CopG family antitoxin
MSIEIPKYKTIRVTIDVWKKLSDIKVRMGFRDYNEVIVYLLEKEVKK